MSTDTQSLEALMAERERIDAQIVRARKSQLPVQCRIVANAVFDALFERGVSQSELGRRLRIGAPRICTLVNHGTLRSRSNSKGGATVGLLCRIADALDCDVQIKLVPRETERQS